MLSDGDVICEYRPFYPGDGSSERESEPYARYVVHSDGDETWIEREPHYALHRSEFTPENWWRFIGSWNGRRLSNYELGMLMDSLWAFKEVVAVAAQRPNKGKYNQMVAKAQRLMKDPAVEMPYHCTATNWLTRKIMMADNPWIGTQVNHEQACWVLHWLMDHPEDFEQARTDVGDLPSAAS